MSGYTVKTIDEMATIHHGLVKLAGAELGLRSFGLQVLDLPPEFADYPEHDHSEDGQEEVYLVLHGAAELQVDGQQLSLGAGEMVRVAPERRRKLVSGADGARVLAIGAAEDSPYQRPEDFSIKVGA